MWSCHNNSLSDRAPFNWIQYSGVVLNHSISMPATMNHGYQPLPTNLSRQIPTYIRMSRFYRCFFAYCIHLHDKSNWSIIIPNLRTNNLCMWLLSWICGYCMYTSCVGGMGGLVLALFHKLETMDSDILKKIRECGTCCNFLKRERIVKVHKSFLSLHDIQDFI